MKSLLKKITVATLYAVMLSALCLTTTTTAKAQTYDPLAVQRINDLIANNGLQATPNAPETWEFATWNDETPKQIIKLIFPPPTNLTGNASFAELTTLQILCCNFGYLTKLDVTNCTQLQILLCMDNYLTEINLTNCKQLQRLDFSKNKLSKFELTNFDKLYELGCYSNNLTELDARNCTQLKYLDCADNNVTELDVTNCTQLEFLNCGYNKLITLDLSNLDSLHTFYGGYQYPLPFTLYKNEQGTYSLPLNLNSPIFANTAISYENGLLTSKDSTVFFSSFTVQTNKPGFELSGAMKFDYSSVGINTIDSGNLNIYPNPATGELRITNYELRIEGVEIFDVYGKKHESTKARKHEGETVIDISHLQAGVYFVKVFTEKGEITKKVVKQ